MRSSPGGGALPEVRRVAVDHRADHGRSFGTNLSTLNSMVATSSSSDVPPVARGDEVALAHRRALRAGDRVEGARDPELLADADVALVGLLAVGAEHRGVALLGEELRHPGQRVLGRPPPAEPGHRPHLGHRGRRLAGGEPLVVVAHRVHPGADGRLVDRVRRDRLRRLAERLDALGLGHDPLVPRLVAHRGTRGSPSPNIAISSRCTSCTPPPNVRTRLRFAWASR